MRESVLVVFLAAIPGCSSTPAGAGSALAAQDDGSGERVSPDEGALNAEIADLSVARLKAAGAADQGPMTRDVHAKAHGCVRGTFTVRGDVPEEFRAGVFAEPGKEYAAWIRFSNGGSRIQDDKEGDARGMAVKLLGVAGDKLLESEREARTQDFLMINHDAFFVKDAKDYAELSRLLAKGSSPAWFFFGRLPWRWTEFAAALRIAKNGKEMVNPLHSRYFSATPNLLGDKNIVKYSAQPCVESPDMRNHFAGSPDYLRLNMQKSLDVRDGKPACFRFLVQKRTDPEAMPVEDPR
ncbi:MAG: catalase, partial [Elusimicrobiota bacterium]